MVNREITSAIQADNADAGEFSELDAQKARRIGYAVFDIHRGFLAFKAERLL
jgi:hypothetical protein